MPVIAMPFTSAERKEGEFEQNGKHKGFGGKIDQGVNRLASLDESRNTRTEKLQTQTTLLAASLRRTRVRMGIALCRKVDAVIKVSMNNRYETPKLHSEKSLCEMLDTPRNKPALQMTSILAR